jgi:hypothetical protein
LLLRLLLHVYQHNHEQQAAPAAADCCSGSSSNGNGSSSVAGATGVMWVSRYQGEGPVVTITTVVKRSVGHTPQFAIATQPTKSKVQTQWLHL